MAGKTTPVLLVTANVGSIFEDPSHMLKIWTEEFLSTVSKLDPKFIALHCQEVGGKNYERSMKHVEDFVRLFMSSEELRLFDKVRVFLDEDYSSAENFTALGNFYFIHESLAEVLIWDFAAMTFVSAKGKEVHSGNIEGVTTKEKSKFPQDFFPECKWSRKGFLRTRWSLNGTVFDLINIHLFHDASNFIAMESFPSVYCKNRRRALEHTLERFHSDSYGIAPYFVFGDFNFRTDTQGVINKLSDGLNAVRVQSNKSNDHTKLQYKDDSSQVVLSLGKKEFSHADHQTVFFDESGMWLKEFDRELEAFGGRLFEFPIAFPPSYPFEEDEKGGNNYMKTRCPAWCDRVILSNTAKNLVNNISQSSCVEYGLMGPNTRMGDHKPVFLKLDLINDAGTVSCCTPCESSSSDKRVLCFGNVAVFETTSWSCSSLSLKKSGSAPSALTLKLDTTAAALAADRFLAPPHASLLHEPYTPESMETPTSSPVPLRIQRDFGEVVDWKNNLDDDDDDDEDVLEFKKMNSKDNGRNDHYSNIIDTKIVNQSENRELNSKSSSNNAYNTSPHGVQHCIPHVLICYSDPQDRIFSSSKVEVKSDLKSRHSEPNLLLKSVSSHCEPNETRLFKLHQIQEDYKTSSSHSSVVDSDMIGDDNSATTNEINEKKVCEDFIPSPAHTTSSPDCVVLQSMSSQSLDHSSQLINQTSTKIVNIPLCGIQCSEEISSSTLSDVKELELGLSSEFTQKNHLTNDDECTNYRHNIHLDRSFEQSQRDGMCTDDIEERIYCQGDIKGCNLKLRNVDSDNNIDLCKVPEPLSCKAPQNSVGIESTSKEVIVNINSNDLQKKPNIPVTHQDSISVVLSEISSQDKTMKPKYKNKKDSRSKSKATNCCCIS